MTVARTSETSITAIKGATVLTGVDLEPLENAVVLFSDVILEVGRIEQVIIPDHATVIDCVGKTLLPGLIDTHVHTQLHPVRRLITGGLTTVRDLGWAPEIVLPFAKKSASWGVHGPAVLAVGPIITEPDGYPTHAHWHGAQITAYQLRSATEAQELVRSLVEQGAWGIKFAVDDRRGPTLPSSLLKVLIEQAHHLGKKVTAHVGTVEELKKVLDAGVDELAHMLMADERIPDELIAQMVENKVAISSSLMFREAHDYSTAIDNAARFLDMGGLLIYGTDIGNGGATPLITGPVPGVEIREFIALTQAGMSPRQAITSATSAAASWLGLDTVGQVTAGFQADLVLVRGTPHVEMKHIGNIEQVWRAGAPAL
jgi:imidazolonepropionase-like amidohydrolase